MSDIALQSLKQACHHHVQWLQEKAEDFEQGRCQRLKIVEGMYDKSTEIAEEFRHQANNLLAVIKAYERLLTKSV